MAFDVTALDHLRAERDVWKIVDEGAEAGEEMEGWQTPAKEIGVGSR